MLNYSSVQINSSVVSNYLWPHGLQHARLAAPPNPGAYSNSCQAHQRCHPSISSSVIPFSSCLQSFPESRSFQWVSSSHQMAKVLEIHLQNQSFQWIFWIDFLLDWLVWSPWSPRDSQESSLTPQFKSIHSSGRSAFLRVQLSHPYMTAGKTIALTIWTLWQSDSSAFQYPV